MRFTALFVAFQGEVLKEFLHLCAISWVIHNAAFLAFTTLCMDEPCKQRTYSLLLPLLLLSLLLLFLLLLCLLLMVL